MDNLEITQDFLKEHFDYCSKGFFIAKDNTNSRCKKGNVVPGCSHHNGYLDIIINRRRVGYHRMIFLWHHGYLPKLVDHINRIKSDNRIENLREATLSLNVANSKKRKNTVSKFKGVTYIKRADKFWARIYINGDQVYIGQFKTEEEAARAYDKKAMEVFGEFAVTNDMLRMRD